MTGLETPLPDFTDCRFASREPSADWMAVVHEGGPVRGFSEMMPAFGEALGEEEIEKVVAYVHSFCRDRSWPRGELNLPRPLVTEKAFPEDEAVLTTSSRHRGARSRDQRLPLRAPLWSAQPDRAECSGQRRSSRERRLARRRWGHHVRIQEGLVS